MRTWGDSWGNTWGDTWGADDTPQVAAPPLGGPDAPRRRTDFSDDDLFQIAIAIIVSGALDG